MFRQLNLWFIYTEIIKISKKACGNKNGHKLSIDKKKLIASNISMHFHSNEYTHIWCTLTYIQIVFEMELRK